MAVATVPTDGVLHVICHYGACHLPLWCRHLLKRSILCVQVREHHVFNQEAYILFYIKAESCHSHVGKHKAQLDRAAPAKQAPGCNGVTSLQPHEHHASPLCTFPGKQECSSERKHHGPHGALLVRSQSTPACRSSGEMEDRRASHHEV